MKSFEQFHSILAPRFSNLRFTYSKQALTSLMLCSIWLFWFGLSRKVFTDAKNSANRMSESSTMSTSYSQRKEMKGRVMPRQRKSRMGIHMNLSSICVGVRVMNTPVQLSQKILLTSLTVPMKLHSISARSYFSLYMRSDSMKPFPLSQALTMRVDSCSFSSTRVSQSQRLILFSLKKSSIFSFLSNFYDRGKDTELCSSFFFLSSMLRMRLPMANRQSFSISLMSNLLAYLAIICRRSRVGSVTQGSWFSLKSSSSSSSRCLSSFSNSRRRRGFFFYCCSIFRFDWCDSLYFYVANDPGLEQEKRYPSFVRSIFYKITKE